MKNKILFMLTIIVLGIIFTGCGNSWKNNAEQVKVYGYINSSDMLNPKLGNAGRINPYVASNSSGTYTIINQILFEIKDNELFELCVLPDKWLEILGATEKYVYCIVDCNSQYAIYRYSLDDCKLEDVFSAAEEEEIYGTRTKGKYAWISGNDCLITTLADGSNNIKRSYTTLYVFNDKQESQRFLVTDDTEIINERYECQMIDDIQFITDKDHNWFVECDGDDEGGMTIVCNNHIYVSGMVEVIDKYSHKWHPGAYTWYIHAYDNKVIYPITGASIDKNNYYEAINGYTQNWYYDSIAVLDTTTGESTTVYVDEKNRIIGYDPDTQEVYLYNYSKNSLTCKNLNNNEMKILTTLEDKDVISFEWEGKKLYYFYGLGENMQYGGMVDIAE